MVVYGGKAIGLVYPLTSSNNDGSIILDVETILENLDDMVLDCELLTPDTNASSQGCRTLLVGYAHNFVDLMDIFISKNTIATAAKYHRRFRVQCPELSVLFSMTIDVGAQNNNESNCISVCSGTAFGKIIVWSIDLSTIQPVTDQTTADQEGGIIHQERVIHPLPTVRTLLSWTDHEGVIFKMRWSSDRRRLASVSDDRTVRIWDMTCAPCKALFVGWGHVSRLWDVLFLPGPQGQETWVATSSEDGTIRIWDVSKGVEEEAIAVLRGHSSHIWCITAMNVGTMNVGTMNGGTMKGGPDVDGNTSITSLANTATTTTTTTTSTKSFAESTSMVLFSGGNDGSVKSWPLLPHIIASALKTDSSLIGVPVPMAPVSTPLRPSTTPIMIATPSAVLPFVTTSSVGEGLEACNSSSSSAAAPPLTELSTIPPSAATTTTATTTTATTPTIDVSDENEINDPSETDDKEAAVKAPVISRRSNAVCA